MKKIFITLTLAMGIKLLMANPIIVPPVLTEVYLDGENIYLEVYFQDIYSQLFDIENMDNFQLISNSCTVGFQQGIEILFNQEMVLDNSDLDGVFTFDPLNDNIILSGDVMFDSYAYGNVPFAQVPSPEPGQSMALLGTYDPETGYYYGFEIGIQNTPTIGYDAWTVNTYGTLEGWIFDIDNEPMQGLQVMDIFTDESGYFVKEGLLCKIFNYISVKHNGNTLYIFSDTIFPDDTTTVEIHLDTTLTRLPKYFFTANSGFHFTTFQIDIPDQYNFSSGYLGIFDLQGRLISKEKVAVHHQEVRWNSEGVNPGIYIYSLVLDNRVFSGKKMIIQ